MNTRLKFPVFLAALVSAVLVPAIPAADLSPAELERRTVERRAVESVIWGLPVVNADLLLQQMLTKTTGKVNEVLFWSRPADDNNRTLTPNPDDIYFLVFFDTKTAGSMVIELPPADTGSLAGSIMTAWQLPVVDVGPDGEDKGKGGRYLIQSPDWDGPPPHGGILLAIDTYSGVAVLRSHLASHSEEDIAKAIAYGKRIKVYPYAVVDTPPPTKFSDAAGVVFDSAIRYDLGFFESLNRYVQSEPWLPRDRAMIEMLKSIGIERGQPFAPDAEKQKILEAAVREAQLLLDSRYAAGLPEFNPGLHWTLPVAPDLSAADGIAYTDSEKYPVNSRGLGHTYAVGDNRHAPASQFSLISIRDKDGDAYDGAKNYRLHVPASPPVRGYWSVTAYDREKHTVIPGLPYASRSSDLLGLNKNADGSVDIYLGPKAPAGQQANWLPTDPQGKFELIVRFYGPEKPLLAKTWKLPDVEKAP